MRSNVNTFKKITSSVTIIIILGVSLCVTTFALISSILSVDNNLFHTGTVAINLNDNKPIIEEHEFVFEPGMTVKKDFFIENQSTWEVYYKLYFNDVEGELANKIDVTIKDGEKILYKGKANELTKESVGAADDVLKLNERRELTIYFYFPQEVGNDAQNTFFAFSLSADAVQTKNNPNKLFN